MTSQELKVGKVVKAVRAALPYYYANDTGRIVKTLRRAAELHLLVDWGPHQRAEGRVPVDDGQWWIAAPNVRGVRRP